MDYKRYTIKELSEIKSNKHNEILDKNFYNIIFSKVS